MDSSRERDFSGVDVNGGRPKKPIMERKKSFREISRMSPEIIRSVMTTTSSSSPTTRKTAPPLPLLTSSSSRSKDDNIWGPVAPFTIFYNGSVLAFNLPHDKAETLLKLVEGGEEIAADLVDERNK